MVFNWWRKLVGRKSKGSDRGRRLTDHPRWRRVRLYAEPLENRTLLSGDFGFAFALGDARTDDGRAITHDAAGNFYVTGGFTGTVDFDPGPTNVSLTSTSPTLTDIFVAKYTSTGALVWARAIGGDGIDEGRGIAVDGSGNVYTTGLFNSSSGGAPVDFDPSPTATSYLTNAGGTDAFVLKLDSTGNFVWARDLGGSFADSGSGIAVDNSGNAYVTGNFADTTNGPSSVATLTSAGGSDAFILELTASGSLAWARTLGGSGQDAGNAIAVDTSGSAYVAGNFFNSATFNGSGGPVLTASASA